MNRPIPKTELRDAVVVAAEEAVPRKVTASPAPSATPVVGHKAAETTSATDSRRNSPHGTKSST
jgi:hypothetical protein